MVTTSFHHFFLKLNFSQEVKMDDNEVGVLIFFGFLAVLIVLMVTLIPVTGNVAGIPITMPVIGWIAVAVFAVIGIILFLKSKFN